MSVKLYKHNETGEVVASIEREKTFARFMKKDSPEGWGVYFNSKEAFLNNYTPLPEPPAEGSTAWAVWVLSMGKPVVSRDCPEVLRTVKDFIEKLACHTGLLKEIVTWQLYEEPKLITEKLPHEFVDGEEVLFSEGAGEWTLRHFLRYTHGEKYPYCCHRKCLWKRCLPYKGNEWLKDTKSEGEHGAVPKGYVPPRVPVLGDDDYWQVGDVVIDLSDDTIATIHKFHGNDVLLKQNDDNYPCPLPLLVIPIGVFNGTGFLRVWYHKHSKVNDDGTVHEHVPTRPHRVEEVQDG